MNPIPEPFADDAKRLPGLFRRWELIAILKTGRIYQIEDAGWHDDGTPLLAVYVSDPDAPAGGCDDCRDGGAQ